MRNLVKISSLLFPLVLFSCTGNNEIAEKAIERPETRTWLIPQEEVKNGGVGKDGIPALTSPRWIPAEEATYLTGNNLVIGYFSDGVARAYPHAILDWHEIINDDVNGRAISIVYCPLTGTGVGWMGEVYGSVTTYGVSGLLYNSNIIPYDRATGSYWSQMRLECVNGEQIGSRAETFQVVETTWETWKEMYPTTLVVSSETGHDRGYGTYPYGDYLTNQDKIIFPVSNADRRLPNKDRVHGVLLDGHAKVYPFSLFPGTLKVVNDSFLSTDLVVAGSRNKNFIVSFARKLLDGTVLSFEAVPDSLPAILKDNEGNIWDVCGNAISGPRVGERLTPTTSFIGYWFAWAAFYPEVEIYGL